MMRLKNRLRSRKGITLMETIVAAGVLAVLALMLNTGLMMAQNSYYRSVGESESQMLLSMLSDLLAQELRYARDVVTEEDGTLRRYTSANYGRNTTLSLDSQGQLRANDRRMLSTGAYGNGAYGIQSYRISYDETTGLFQVELTVSGTHAAEQTTEFSVRCLNAAGT